MNRLANRGALRARIGVLLGATLCAASACAPGPIECLRAVNCVRSCGGPVEQSGCMACPAGTFDDLACRGDGGDAGDAAPNDAADASDAPPGDAAPVSCGTQTCGPDQVCVMPCSGIDSGMPLVPSCVTVPAGCAGGTPSCGCLTAGGVCNGAGTPTVPACRQDGPRQFACTGCA